MNPEDRMRELGSRDNATPSEAEWLEFRARGRRSVRNRRLAGAVGGVGLLLAIAVGYIVVTAPEPPHGHTRLDVGPATKAPSPDDPPSKTPVPPKETVALQQWFVENDKLQVFYEEVPKSQTPATDAINALLDGVPSILAETGVSTMIPEGTTLKSITINEGTATVTFVGDYPDESDTQQNLAIAQVIYTLTQFDTVERVAPSWESPEAGGVGSRPEGRDGYHTFLPQIVVESPYSDQTVERTFTLSGIANVFEATVSYRFFDEHGDVLQEGFTTATCGSGCWGEFQEDVTFKGKADFAVLQVYESSAEDGSPLHMVEIPLNFAKEETPD